MAAFPASVVNAAPIQAATVGSEAFDETTAAALAKAQGARVEVSRLRTETDQVFKNPDGSTTRDQYLEPVRVRRGATWVPVDSTLTRAADGSLVPAASAVDMVFSPGGAGPLVRVGRAGVTLALTWPTSLPVPTVSGAAATYSEVFPGVDLLLTSVGTSFTEHLIVKTAAAGQQAAVRSLTLGTRVSGGRLVPQPAGGFEVVDRGGRPAWSSPAPQMWDSSADTSATAAGAPAIGSPAGLSGATPSAATGAAAPRSGQDGAREGDTVKAMGQRIGVSSMLLTPDATLLDAASTRYPVTIDPTTGPAIYNWAEIDKTYPTTSYYNFADADQGVGYQNFSGVSTKRLYFAFNTSAYLGKTVTVATFSAFETYSGACSAGTVQAYLTTNFAAGVTWNTRPSRASVNLSSFSTKAGRPDCNPGGYLANFNVVAGVKTQVAAKATVTTIGLVGDSETNTSSWMRFAGPKNATVAHRPSLSVTYNSISNTPSMAKMFAPDINTGCGTTVATSKTFNQTSSNASLIATGSDADGGNLKMTFRLYNAVTGAYVNDNVLGPVATTSLGYQFKFKVPVTWGDGSYYWLARADDGIQFGAWSGACYITLDKTAPPKPSITSTTFTADTLAPADIALGAFTLSSVGATSFDYSWNDVLSGHLNVNGTFGGVPAWTGDLKIPVATVGWLTVMAVDAAGNHSPTSDAFFVKKAVNGKLAQYLFNDPTTIDPAPAVATDTADYAGITPADAPHYAFDLDTGGSAWDVGRFADLGAQNRSLAWDGTGEEADSDQPPAVSQRSFTIGAWVELTDASSSRTVIAQNLDVAGGTDSAASAYDIGYDQVSDKFVFHVTTATGLTLTASDALPSSITSSTGEVIALPRIGAWVYLAAVYDQAGGGTIRLDAGHEFWTVPVGDPGSTELHIQTGAGVALGGVDVAAGKGAFRVGDGGPIGKSPWFGLVDNLSVWQQALPNSETDNQLRLSAQDPI